MKRSFTGTIVTFLMGIVTIIATLQGNIVAGLLQEGINPLWLSLSFILMSGILLWKDVVTHTQSVRAEKYNAELARKGRGALISRMNSYWVEGVLKNSLQDLVRIELRLEERPEVVQEPWKLLFHKLPTKSYQLPNDVSIVEFFDKCGGEFLILGNPGAGKTTLLLELTEALLVRATQNEEEPLPVVLPLSSWATNRRKLDEWVVGEMENRYFIPRKLASEWLFDGKLILLFDGFDEVSIEFHEILIDLINTFRRQFGFTKIVLCSRITDYNDVAVRVQLQNALVVQPLTRGQVTAYFLSLQDRFRGLLKVLRSDSILWELLETPLMLSIVTLVYRDVAEDRITVFYSSKEWREFLFDRYTFLMLSRERAKWRFSQHDTILFLVWLASRMKRLSLTAIYPHEMELYWFSEKEWKEYYTIQVFTGLALGALFFAPLYYVLEFLQIIPAGFAEFTGITLLGSSVCIFWAKYMLDTQRLVRADSILATIQEFTIYGALCGSAGGLFIGLLLFLSSYELEAIRLSFFVGMGLGFLPGTLAGAIIYIQVQLQSLWVRLILHKHNSIPWEIDEILLYCADRIILRKVGNSFIFIHRLLLDHFAQIAVDAQLKQEDEAKKSARAEGASNKRRDEFDRIIGGIGESSLFDNENSSIPRRQVRRRPLSKNERDSGKDLLDELLENVEKERNSAEEKRPRRPRRYSG